MFWLKSLLDIFTSCHSSQGALSLGPKGPRRAAITEWYWLLMVLLLRVSFRPCSSSLAFLRTSSEFREFLEEHWVESSTRAQKEVSWWWPGLCICPTQNLGVLNQLNVYSFQIAILQCIVSIENYPAFSFPITCKPKRIFKVCVQVNCCKDIYFWVNFFLH